MFDEYFKELDPVKRKELSDALQPEPGQEDALAQIRALFPIRYTANKKGGYNDGFIAALVSLRNISENPRGRLGAREDTRQVQNAVHTLCLDRTEEFSPDILYHEMCQLIRLYIATCLDDYHYQSILFGMGRLSKEKVIAKIDLDMHMIWDPVPKYLGGEENYLPLKNAIIDIKDENL